jgi:hypothetical protein
MEGIGKSDGEGRHVTYMENYYNVPFSCTRTEPDFTMPGKGVGTLFKVYSPQNYKISSIMYISYMTSNSSVLFIGPIDALHKLSIHFSIMKYRFNCLKQYA